MNPGSLNERITRALAFMLRHQPEDFDLELDRFGWGDLEDVLYALQERLGSSVSEDEVHTALGASDRARYEVENGRIRALYGHSFPIDPGEATEPPDELFIGVGSRDAERAEDSGLRSGRRAFLHLARTEDEARESGRRVAKDYAVVTVFAGEAFDEGIDFYDRGSLFLADEIPTEFLEVGDIEHDGIDRDAGRRSRGRRNVDGPRGPRRGRGRDDDRGPRSRGPREDDDRDRGPAAREPERRSERPAEREEPAARTEERPSKPEREQKPKAAPSPKPAAAGSGFGAGLVGRKAREAAQEREPERAPRKAPVEAIVPQPRPAARRQPDPEPNVEPEVDVPRQDADAPPSAGGFGAGLS